MSAMRHLLSAYGVTTRWRFAGLAVVAAFVLVVAIACSLGGSEGALDRRLFAMPPDAVEMDADVVRAASAEAKPLYTAHCASCHGADLRGRNATAAPNLIDPQWLYGTGRVSEIERTILFGIRTGNGKARNVAEMPALGQAGLLQPAEIHDIVSYLLGLNHQGQAAAAVARGRALYLVKGGCVECHGRDARGNPDYGAPDLTTGSWDNGGTAADLYNSIYYGRHAICPAWYGILSLGRIRALAVYIHAIAAGGAA